MRPGLTWAEAVAVDGNVSVKLILAHRQGTSKLSSNIRLKEFSSMKWSTVCITSEVNGPSPLAHSTFDNPGYLRPNMCLFDDARGHFTFQWFFRSFNLCSAAWMVIHHFTSSCTAQFRDMATAMTCVTIYQSVDLLIQKKKHLAFETLFTVIV